jgi:tetratricopeptide (TPR) repeat protein
MLILCLSAILLTSCQHNTEQPCDDHFTKGNNYCLKGDFENAIKEFDLAIKSDPNNANAFYGKGVVYTLMSDYDKAK